MSAQANLRLWRRPEVWKPTGQSAFTIRTFPASYCGRGLSPTDGQRPNCKSPAPFSVRVTGARPIACGRCPLQGTVSLPNFRHCPHFEYRSRPLGPKESSTACRRIPYPLARFSIAAGQSTKSSAPNARRLRPSPSGRARIVPCTAARALGHGAPPTRHPRP